MNGIDCECVHAMFMFMFMCSCVHVFMFMLMCSCVHVHVHGECVHATSVNMFKNKIDNYFKRSGYV